MSRAESSRGSRSTRLLPREQAGPSAIAGDLVPVPVGQETGLPLIWCPKCGLARIIELRVKKENSNQGRVFFKCERNGVSGFFLVYDCRKVRV
jgi:hypothetical protein